MCVGMCVGRKGSLDEGSFSIYCPHKLYSWINKYFDFDFDLKRNKQINIISKVNI